MIFLLILNDLQEKSIKSHLMHLCETLDEYRDKPVGGLLCDKISCDEVLHYCNVTQNDSEVTPTLNSVSVITENVSAVDDVCEKVASGP